LKNDAIFRRRLNLSLCLNRFIFHLDNMRNVQDNYVCPIIDCKRSFYKRYVYKQHIAKHNLVSLEEHTNLSQINGDC